MHQFHHFSHQQRDSRTLARNGIQIFFWFLTYSTAATNTNLSYMFTTNTKRNCAGVFIYCRIKIGRGKEVIKP